ncbi:MAG: aminotransferase class I/II-fold pyridoxal phosphate-dependent enzyme [Clostridia bacterium]|nr:aminotransferase class I/II-fold pyridoxal phosphate-dependent enzyme [Clostridia bacterium]MBQ8771873.1 aminotransferase class I/II-fold pyridoxal phosphate-dependent enzyme [Clostridia bacterium]
MKTPIVDFVKKYAQANPTRLHVPGHKGKCVLGCEQWDLTEIVGADSLYNANGIIWESQQNASAVFGCPTFYSAEGSSLAIRAMLYLLQQHAISQSAEPKILATRNVHKSFVSGAALLDIDVQWLSNSSNSYLSCTIDLDNLQQALQQHKPTALYVTSPDYLGNLADIANVAKVCHQHNVLLAVDNAHGSYLKFLNPSLHPIDLGADICCDSAHKTLPVLTGGAYLHISPNSPSSLVQNAPNALSLFGSTSPSYLIMQSLDLANQTVDSDQYKAQLQHCCGDVSQLKANLANIGYQLCGNEPLKVTLATKGYGYFGTQVAQHLQDNNVYVEMFDDDFVVMMFSPSNNEADFQHTLKALACLPQKQAIPHTNIEPHQPQRAMTLRQATLACTTVLPVSQCLGRVCAQANVACPPCVPIIMCGEVVDQQTIDTLLYYKTTHLQVVK